MVRRAAHWLFTVLRAVAMTAAFIAALAGVQAAGRWASAYIGLWTIPVLGGPFLVAAIWIEICDQRHAGVRRRIFRWHND